MENQSLSTTTASLAWSFPVEITEHVLCILWKSTQYRHSGLQYGGNQRRARWKLFAVLSAVNKQWNCIMLRLSLAYVLVEDHKDLYALRILRERYVAAQLAIGGTSTLPCQFFSLYVFSGVLMDLSALLALVQTCRAAEIEVAIPARRVDQWRALEGLLHALHGLQSLHGLATASDLPSCQPGWFPEHRHHVFHPLRQTIQLFGNLVVVVATEALRL